VNTTNNKDATTKASVIANIRATIGAKVPNTPGTMAIS
jgi:hypothetical protein